MEAAGLVPRGRERAWAALLLAPTLLGLALGALGSIAATLALSLFDWDLFSPPAFVGVENYADLPSDRGFLRALANTSLFAALYVPLVVAISLGIALLLNREVRGRALFRVLFFLPVVTSPVAVGLVWSWVLARDHGLLNDLLGLVGLGPVNWLGRSNALYSVVLVNVWGAIGEGMIIFLAGLQAIPASLLEAATLDGAGRWRRFWRITLPLLAPSVLFQTILATINAFQAFDYVYILTSTQGGGSTVPTLVFNLYREGFNYFRMGDAAAQAVVLAAIVMVLTLLYTRAQRRWT